MVIIPAPLIETTSSNGRKFQNSRNSNRTMISPPLCRSLNLNSRFSVLLSPNQSAFHVGYLKFEKTWRHSMSVSSLPIIRNEVLNINGTEALTCVPDNVVVTPSVKGSAFLGAVSKERSCRHVFKLGLLEDRRLLCLFRFNIWWMTPRFGNSGSDIPVETQMLLLEAGEESSVDEASDEATGYILFLPVLDGEFRSSLQGNSANELEFCIESGDPAIASSQFLEAVFVNYGDNPFDLMKESMKILERHMGTFVRLENKKLPGMLDWFGWCTWDAFYQEVNPQGIEDGLKSLSEGGTPAKFLIIDDGWQDTENEFQKEGEPYVEGSQWGARLVSIKENNKFRQTSNGNPDGGTKELKNFIRKIKSTFGLKYVYVWHALMGYWGGLHPNAPATEKYNPKLLYPVQSPGTLTNRRDNAMDSMEKYGVGAIDPSKASEFYNDLHSYLVSQNVDGVKVDVQNITETLAFYLGGRVSLTQQFHQALEESIARNFLDNSIICCMALSTDNVYSSKRSAITRASDDYMPRNDKSQTLHVASVAFNSMFLGEILVPDWDMFYSHHYSADFHAAARAVGGCGIYVSDKPGDHDFTLLKRLVLPDGSVLRARYPGRPTRDCLFNDPIIDGKSLLKIWNLNKYSGVIGIFNCQGAGTWYCMDVQNNSDTKISCLTGHVRPVDVEYLEEVAGEKWTEDCAVFSFKTGSVCRLPKRKHVDISLNVLECDVFTVSPIKVYSGRIQFATIGLIDMYNSGGAVKEMHFMEDDSKCLLNIKGKGSGRFGAYSTVKPKFCIVNSKEEDFDFNDKDNFLTTVTPHGTTLWNIDIHF